MKISFAFVIEVKEWENKEKRNKLTNSMTTREIIKGKELALKIVCQSKYKKIMAHRFG